MMRKAVSNIPAQSGTPIHPCGSGMLPRQGELLKDAWVAISGLIARRVKHSLLRRGMSQKEFARRIGILPQQMSRIMTGNVNLTIKTIAKMELALGINLLHVAEDEAGSGGL